MKVKALIKSKPKTSTKEGSYDVGDIIYFWPLNKDHGSRTFTSMMAVVIDLKVPCGDKFDVQPPPCNTCKDNHIDTCDIIKYSKGVWTSGDVLNPPKLIKKSRYNINRSQFISGESEKLTVKIEKTEAEKDIMLTRALDNIQLESVIKDKVK